MAKGNWHRLGGDTDNRSEALAKVRELRASDTKRHPSARSDYRVVKNPSYLGGYHIEFRLKNAV